MPLTQQIIRQIVKDEVGSELKGTNQKIDQLEKDRLYVNFTRDKLGRLHSITVKSKKEVKHRAKPAYFSPVTEASTTPKIIAKKYLGRKIRNGLGTGEICGYSINYILVGFDNERGHDTTANRDHKGKVILKEYASYWWVYLDDVLSQLNK